MKPGMGKHYHKVAGVVTVVIPGHIITCDLWQLGGAADKFEALDPDVPEPEPKPRPISGNDILHGTTGRPINDVPLDDDVIKYTVGPSRAGKEGKAFWTAPRMWPGQTVFILGGGPSLQNIDLNRLRESRVIAVNNAYQLAEWIDVVFYGDCRWYENHKDALLNFGGLKVTCCDQHTKLPGIKAIKRRNGTVGLDCNPALIAWNLSSGAAAINLAVHFGAKKIVLLGFDMRKINGRNNWHTSHAEGQDRDPYARFLATFPPIARDLIALDVECVNATPGSALGVFPIVDPAEVLP